jgi:hypothetical protein
MCHKWESVKHSVGITCVKPITKPLSPCDVCAITLDETVSGVGHTQTAHLLLRFRDSRGGGGGGGNLAKLVSAYQKIESVVALL